MVAELSKPTYYELLRLPLWQEKRLRIMDRARFRCENCGTNELTLNVHHKLYIKGAKPWEYRDDELQCLCENCHESEHALRNRLNEAVAKLNPLDVENIVGYVEAMVACDVAQDFLDPRQPDGMRQGWEDVAFPITSAEHAAGFAALLIQRVPPKHRLVRMLADSGRASLREVFDPTTSEGSK